jgi:hypothetical protein
MKQHPLIEALGLRADTIVDMTIQPWQLVEESVYNDQRGELNGFYGKKHTEETKKMISDHHKGKVYTSGYKHTPETKAKMSASKIGKPSNRLGKEAWNKGKKMTSEFCANTSKGKTGVKFSEEGKKNMAEAARNRVKIKCSKCGIEAIPQNIKRWHEDNCKHGS